MIAGLLRAGSLVALAKGLRAEARHVVRRTVVGAVILFLVSLAFAFGLAAFMVWLALEIGTVPALGFVALGFLVLAGVFTLLARATDPRRRVATPPRPRPITESVKQALDSVEAGAAAAVRRGFRCGFDGRVDAPRRSRRLPPGAPDISTQEVVIGTARGTMAIEPRSGDTDEARASAAAPLPRLVRVSIVGTFVILLIGVLYYARGFFLPLILALLTTLTFMPFVRSMSRRGVPPAASAMLVVLGIGLVAAGLSPCSRSRRRACSQTPRRS